MSTLDTLQQLNMDLDTALAEMRKPAAVADDLGSEAESETAESEPTLDLPGNSGKPGGDADWRLWVYQWRREFAPAWFREREER